MGLACRLPAGAVILMAVRDQCFGVCPSPGPKPKSEWNYCSVGAIQQTLNLLVRVTD
jgi:hypothetical protein